MTHNHTNPDIDKEKTKFNFPYKNLSYKQLCDAYDKRISQVYIGRQSSGKNARVTLQKIVVYAPPKDSVFHVPDTLYACVHAYKLIFEYIEIFYNTVCIHSHCGYLSPNQYEEQFLENLAENVSKMAS